MKQFIVKVQLPVTSSEAQPPALVYNEDRSVHYMLPVTDDLVKFMTLEEGDPPEPKLYALAHIEDDKIVLDDYAEWQDW